MRVIEDSKVVRIHIKPNQAKIARMGTGTDIDSIWHKEKIGSAFAPGGAVLRGLDKEEEKLYLGRLLGVSPNDNSWETATRDYWANIGVIVPPANKEGAGGGVTLEVGFRYNNEKDAEIGRKEAEKEAERYEAWSNSSVNKLASNIRRFKESFSERQRVGEPININDYILYRYVLVNPCVALDVKYIDMSAKIRFYIHDNKVSVRADHAKMLARREASILLTEMLGDRDRVQCILDVMHKELQLVREKSNKDYFVTTDTERDLALDAIATAYPLDFSVYAKDSKLVLKATIERCIKYDVLRRLPHTNTVYFGDNQLLGNSIDEVVEFLENTQNAEINKQIKARLIEYKK